MQKISVFECLVFRGFKNNSKNDDDVAQGLASTKK